MKKLQISLCLAIILTLSCFCFGQKSKPVAENFTAVSISGHTIDLASLKGKIVVLTFWSPRCAICNSEIPKLNGLVSAFKDKNVVFIGLTTDNSSKVQNFLKSKPFNFEIVPNSFDVVLKYADKDRAGNINMGFPAHFLVNQNGEIELKTNGFDKTDELNAQINRLLSVNRTKAE